jgi:hypothetical protein
MVLKGLHSIHIGNCILILLVIWVATGYGVIMDGNEGVAKNGFRLGSVMIFPFGVYLDCAGSPVLRTSKSDHLHLTSPRQDKALCFWFPHHPKLVDSLLAMALECYEGGQVVMLMRSSILRSVRLCV